MGAQESTHRMTIVNDATGEISMTQSALKNVRKAQRPQSSDAETQTETSGRENAGNVVYAAPMETLTLRKRHEEEINRVEQSWKTRLSSYQRQNEQLSKTTTERLAADLTSIEEKYTNRQRYEPVCPDIEQKVEECLKKNASMSLRCSQEVKDFVGCIDDFRQRVLSSKTVLQ